MQLKDYIPLIDVKKRNIFFSGISFDSSKVKKNDIFFAIRGNNIDGNKFIPEVIKKGCKIIITEKRIKKSQNGVIFIRTKNVRKLLAEVSFKIYNKMPKNLKYKRYFYSILVFVMSLIVLHQPLRHYQ